MATAKDVGTTISKKGDKALKIAKSSNIGRRTNRKVDNTTDNNRITNIKATHLNPMLLELQFAIRFGSG